METRYAISALEIKKSVNFGQSYFSRLLQVKINRILSDAIRCIDAFQKKVIMTVAISDALYLYKT